MTESLIAALRKAGISGNHGFIARLVGCVGITDYEARDNPSKPYVIATRRDGGRALHIFHGYTMGFTSREEIQRFLGDTALPEYDDKSGVWWVRHPDNQIREGGTRATDTRRVAGFCPCGMQLSLTGICDYCD